MGSRFSRLREAGNYSRCAPRARKDASLAAAVAAVVELNRGGGLSDGGGGGGCHFPSRDPKVGAPKAGAPKAGAPPESRQGGGGVFWRVAAQVRRLLRQAGRGGKGSPRIALPPHCRAPNAPSATAPAPRDRTPAPRPPLHPCGSLCLVVCVRHRPESERRGRIKAERKAADTLAREILFIAPYDYPQMQ
jgi:hypothetical protein